jgi:two-component system LytT family response regulator
MTDTPLRILLVDDEAHARKRLRTLLAGRADRVVTGEADSARAGLEACERLRPDLVLLDVQMPVEDGLWLAGRLADVGTGGPAVVFVTAHDPFAVRAFELNAVDYLLKPVTAERLERALERVREGRLGRREKEPGPGRAGAGDPVLLRDAGRYRFAAAEDILAVEADGNFSRVFLAGEAAFYLLRSIGEWEALLPEGCFARVERSLLVNVRAVREFRAVSRDEARVRLRGAEREFKLGRTAAARLRAALRGAAG